MKLYMLIVWNGNFLKGNCSAYPLQLQADSTSINSNAASGVQMKNPYEIFFLNNETFFYAGKVHH